MNKLIFKGNAWDFTLSNIGLALLDVVTFGLATPYHLYWVVKYFIEHTEMRGGVKNA